MTTEIYFEEMRQEGLEKGKVLGLIRLTLKKYKKGLSVSEVAELFEENESVIQLIFDAIDRSDSQEPEQIYEQMETLGSM